MGLGDKVENMAAEKDGLAKRRVGDLT